MRVALLLLLVSGAFAAANADGAQLLSGAKGKAAQLGALANSTAADLKHPKALLGAAYGKAYDAMLNVKGVVGANAQVLKAGLTGSATFLERQAQDDAVALAAKAGNKTGVPVAGKLRGVFGLLNGVQGAAHGVVENAQEVGQASLASIKKVVMG